MLFLIESNSLIISFLIIDVMCSCIGLITNVMFWHNEITWFDSLCEF
jgi:hypothetical protein